MHLLTRPVLGSVIIIIFTQLSADVHVVWLNINILATVKWCSCSVEYM